MKPKYQHKNAFLSAFLFTLLWIGFQPMQAQLMDALSNPELSVNLEHPPGLGIKINKVIFNNAGGGNCTGQVLDALISDFVNNNVEVIDRGNLDAILAEHKFNFTGYVDQTTAVAMGKILGPSTLISIKVLRCETKVQDNLYRIEEKYDSETKRKYTVKAFISKTSFMLKVSVQTTDLTTGKIFAAKVFDYAPEFENKSYSGQPEAPSEYEVQEHAFNSFKNDVHKLYFSWFEKVSFYYFDDKDGNLKQAYQALKGGNLDEAFKISLENLEVCKNDTDIKPKTLAHAYYNVGMGYMFKDEYDLAIQHFEESKKLRPGNIVNDAIAKCQKAKNLMNEMQKVETSAQLETAKEQAETQKAQKAQEAATLTNADVIELAKKKLPNSLIIQKIKTSPCNFDTSTDALVKLTDAGVHEDVIIEMMNKK